jgi:uncharacterized membrane protein
MNARESENYLAISRSSSASKNVEIFWAEIYLRRLFVHSTNEDLLNIKRKGDPKSRTLYRTSDTTATRNTCVIKLILLACFTYIQW